MTGEDDDDDDDVTDHVTTATGLPPTVVALLGRMTSYRDRMAWTVVEDSCRVCLTLSWDIDERRRRQRRDDRQLSLELAPCKQSLWSRIRRSLHSRRTVSADSSTSDAHRTRQHHHPPMTSHWRSRDDDERASAARDMWRSAVRRHRSLSAGRVVSGPADAGAAAAAWKRRRQRSWNDGESVEQSTATKDLSDATQSRRRLLPSLSLPERFLSPPPLHHHHHHRHRYQHQQLTPQDEFIRACSPQYNFVRQTQPSVGSPALFLNGIIVTSVSPQSAETLSPRP